MATTPGHTLGDLIQRNAVRYPSVPAYIDGDVNGDGATALSHAVLRERATALVAALSDAGLRRQDRIGLLGRNGIGYGHVLTACWLGGIAVATVNFRLAVPEMLRILTDAAPRALFVDAEFLPVAEAARHELGIELVVCVDGPSGPGHVGLTELTEEGSGRDLPFAARLEDVACLIYTSGTTGRPRGCILGQQEMHAGASLMNAEMRTGSDDRILLAMPQFHIGATAMGLGTHLRGGTAVLQRAFEPFALLHAIRDHAVTTLHLAPTMLREVLDAAGPDELAGVRTVVYSAAPISAPTLNAALAAMPDAGFLNLYGQTEVMTSGLSRELHRGDGGPAHARRLSSVGHPFPEVRVRIVDDEDSDVAMGEPGEVLVRSPAMFRGYWNDSGSTGRTLRDGWCHTGDIGRFDEEGLLHLVDRKADVVISGGESVYSLEVENALLAHPGVAACAVIGVPDERWGEAICAVVVAAPEARFTPAELRGHVADRLARYKAPRHVVVDDALPLLSTGKVDKKALRSRYR